MGRRPTSPRRAHLYGSTGHGPGAPCFVAEIEALDVQSDRLPAPSEGHALDHELVLDDDSIAGIAGFAATAHAPDPGMLWNGSRPSASFWRMMSRRRG